MLLEVTLLRLGVRALNKVILTGRIATPLNYRTLDSGDSMISFNLAVKRGYKDKYGEVGTDFIRCVGFRRLADILVKYKDTGNYIEVEGRLTKRRYYVDGQENYVVEVQLTNVNFPAIGEGKGVNKQTGAKTTPVEEMEDIKVDEDDLPF